MPCYFLCRLCAAFFVDPVKSDWAQPFWMEGHGWKDRKSDGGENDRTVWNRSKGCCRAVGPSICQDCYEVSKDVVEQFRENYDEKYWEKLFYEKENGKYQLNLWEANRIVLQEAGIPKEQIAVTNICTCCDSELLFRIGHHRGREETLGHFLC